MSIFPGGELSGNEHWSEHLDAVVVIITRVGFSSADWSFTKVILDIILEIILGVILEVILGPKMG